ncbi:MAG: glycosyltransferase family 39 protein [Terriglobales bacterium]
MNVSVEAARLSSPESEAHDRQGIAIAALFAIAAFLLQMLTNGQYGYFRDELYYIACSKHLAFGYVDMAPLAPFLLRICRAIFGDSLHSIRLIPALSYAVGVFLTGLLTREFGGKRFAIILACGAWLLAPVINGNATRYAMNANEPVLWMAAVYFLIRAQRLERPQLLLWCGLFLGIAIENKHSAVFFIGALVFGLSLTGDRRIFRTKYFWIAVAIAAVLALPNFMWQATHGFATWVDLNNVRREHKNVELPPLAFMHQQFDTLDPINSLIWIPGLLWLLFAGDAKRYGYLGVTFIGFFLFMMKMHAKDYYAAPIYAMLFAAGAVFWQHASEHRAWRWLRGALPLIVFGMGLITIPITLPILPVDKIVPYRELLGLKIEKSETHMSSPLPQYFSDQFGWPEMVATVAQVYNALPPDRRAKTAILAGNYGEAGAIDFFGGQYGLPESISAHQNYYYWRYRDYTSDDTFILLQWPREGAEQACRSYEEGPTLDPKWAMAEEHYTIWICHGFKRAMPDLWERLKHWN